MPGAACLILAQVQDAQTEELYILYEGEQPKEKAYITPGADNALFDVNYIIVENCGDEEATLYMQVSDDDNVYGYGPGYKLMYERETLKPGERFGNWKFTADVLNEPFKLYLHIGVEKEPETEKVFPLEFVPKGPIAKITQIYIHENTYCNVYKVHPEGQQALITPGPDQIHFMSGYIKVKNEGNVGGDLFMALIKEGELLYRKTEYVKPGDTLENDEFWIEMPEEDVTLTLRAGVIVDSEAVITDEKNFTCYLAYALEISVNDPTMGTTSPEPGSHPYKKDSTVTVEAYPNEGYYLAYWLLDGEAKSGYDNKIDVYMDYHHTLQAVFEEVVYRKLTISVNDPAMGTTDPPPGEYSYPEGEKVTVTAYPNEGYYLAYWELDGAKVEPHPGDTIEITMDTDHTLQAVFEEVGLATVKGIVRGIMGRPVKGAVITINTKRTYSGPDGTYQIKLPTGEYILECEHWLYNTYRTTLSITEEKTYIEDINLTLKTSIMASAGGLLSGIILGIATLLRRGK